MSWRTILISDLRPEYFEVVRFLIDSMAIGIVLPVYNDLFQIFTYDKGIGYIVRCISNQNVLSDSNL